MQDNNIREKCRELATRLYELDGEVYKSVGSSLGRTFTGDREGTIRNLSALMYTKPDGHLLRSEMALILSLIHIFFSLPSFFSTVTPGQLPTY